MLSPVNPCGSHQFAYAISMNCEQVATLTTEPRVKPLATIHRSEHWLPILFWCIWLLANWVLARPDEATPPAVRWMLLAIVLGLMLLWPAWQLSLAPDLRRPARPIGEQLRVLTQVLGLLLILQLVLWPLRLTAGWTIEQTLWLGGGLSGWMLLTGLITAWGCQKVTEWGRILAMLLAVLLVVGEPLLRLAIPIPSTWSGQVPGMPLAGPLRMVQALGAPAGQWALLGWREYVYGLLGIAIFGWITMLILGIRRRHVYNDG